jgi:hypothetical protein
MTDVDTPASSSPPKGTIDKKQKREARRAAALRANLRRRKAKVIPTEIPQEPAAPAAGSETQGKNDA